jgi:hypothetical protein
LGSFAQKIFVAGKEIFTRTQSSEYTFLHSSSIISSGYDYSRGMHGLNFVIFDKDDNVKDSVAFDVILDATFPCRSDAGSYFNFVNFEVKWN